jgi:hypothetical protein
MSTYSWLPVLPQQAATCGTATMLPASADCSVGAPVPRHCPAGDTAVVANTTQAAAHQGASLSAPAAWLPALPWVGLNHPSHTPAQDIQK